MISALSLCLEGRLGIFSKKVCIWKMNLILRRGQNTLKLKFTNASDAGHFECQVSTNPKISQDFKLTVVGE